MKKQICALILVFFCGNFYAQNSRIDKLHSLLKSDKEDTLKVIHAFKLCEEYCRLGEFDKAMPYGTMALDLAKKLGFKKGMADALANIAIAHFYQKDLPEALKDHIAALKIREEIGDKYGIAYSYHNIGNIYLDQDNYPEALRNYSLSLVLSKELGDKEAVAGGYTGIGNIYVHQNNYPDALKNYDSALKVFQELDHKGGIASTYNNRGVICEYNGKYEEAYGDYLKSLKIKEEIGDKYTLASAYNNLGTLCIRRKDLAGADRYLGKALALCMETGNQDGLKDAYLGLALTDSARGNFKAAFEHYKLSVAYRDSVNEEEAKAKTLQTTLTYEREKKEKEIRLLNAELLNKKKDEELLHAKVKEKNTVIITVSAVAVLLIVLGWLLFNRRQLRQKNAHQAEINRQQEQTAIAIIRSQENERNRIAQDLHDGIGTFLSTLKLNLQGMEDSVPAEKAQQYRNTSLLVDRTSAELRNILKNLSSETLQENGLAGALKELTENVNRLSGPTHFNFVSHGIRERLDGIVEINMYRVAQELINNCIRHAGATQATLQLIDHEQSIVFTMEDNGKGFDPEHGEKGSRQGMGLKNILSRVTFIKGTLKTESSPGKGSTFVIEIPKQKT